MDLYMMNCELLATCSALGYLEGDVYNKEPDCLESVKDLIRYLRYEDETRDVRQQLGAAQILQNDLLPLITQYPQDKLLFDAVVRLMVNLTQPALLCFGKVPRDPGSRHCFLQVVSYLQAYKEAFASAKVFGVLSEKLYELLQLDWEQRQEEDTLLVERILLLVRNVLHIPAGPEEEKSVDDDASTHDRVLWAVHVSGMDDLLKFLASSSAEQQWGLHVLEIISLMFRDQQDPEQLAASGQARPAKEQAADVRDLEVLRQRELAERKSRAFQRGSRHSRFGGSYVVQGLKSIGDRDLVFHKGLHNLKEHSHDLGKEPRRVPKRRQPAREAEPRRRSALNVRLFLREFCGDFLESCYNPLMRLVKDQLLREKSQQHDETYYLWAVAFFMAFNRGRHFRPELVSETVSVRAFHFIEQNLTAYYEAMLLDKQEATSWARRMHLALKAYRELLTTVQEMDRSPDEAVRDSSKVIKNNIFYLMEFRELFLALFRKFEESRQPRSFLRDLVETTHLFLKMLEAFCRGRNNLVVQSKRVRRKKQPRAGRAAPPAQPCAPQELEELWPSLAEQLGACAQGAEPLPEDVVPFDAASETPVEEQRAEAMVRIQDSLLGRRAPAALTLLRSAREVWPEQDVFGSPQAALEEEIQLLRQILFAPLPRQAVPEVEEPGEEEEEEEEVEEELASVQVSEKEFNFLDYLKRFASTSVVKAYVLLLRGYRQNSAHTNHCVAKMLHRIACDLKMEALLFQLSVFCIFRRLLSDPSAAAYKELVTFAKYILGKFFALAATNKKVYVELLFWKSTATVREMTEGYGSLQEGEGSGVRRAPKWTPQEEEELRELYLKYKGVEGADVVGSILAHLRAPGRTRKQVVKQLVRLGLAESERDFPRERKGTRLVLWTEEQELELQRLFEEFQGADDILGNIMKHLTAKRARARVVEKLLSLGLVAERKELYKKRKRKPGLPGMSEDRSPWGAAGREDSAEEESDGEEEEEAWEEGGSGDRAVEGHREQGSENQVAPEQDVQGLARRLRQGGLAGSLLWLQNCLNRAAEDREEDGTAQPVPLVPLLEENEDAVENQGFQKLLRKVGVRAPANEQESFWRIPAKLSPEQLRRAAASIAQEEPEGEEGSLGGPDSGPEQRAQALQTLRLARRKRGAPAVPEEETPGPKQPPVSPKADLERDPPVQSQLGPKRSRVIHSDDDEDPESRAAVPARPDPSSAGEGTRPPRWRKRLRIEEEEEED
ncbi:protein timeless homolog isoform X1 [Mauremys mutica]|uniref:protein timeless homolog isoform X1 n=1 Tax=Mauremys mutica TaxID=74926 RepID=UPI001D1606D6|nr:protein timeless homolog isoform X1 [Mauremys mutica]